jgi:cytochrome c peroxidase
VDKRPYPSFVKSYGHNGVFKSLKQIVHFYNTRDVLPRCETTSKPSVGVNCWPAPEVPENVNDSELGNLGLTDAEEDAIVAFLGTLSDR